MVRAASLLLAALSGAHPAHPLHTTFTTLEWRPETKRLHIAVRVFTQDLRERLVRAAAATDSAACRYARGAVILRAGEGVGHPVTPTGCTVRDSGDVTWILMDARLPAVTGLRVSSTFLLEWFTDQVNIVRADVGGRPRTLIFTRGDGAKAIGA